MLNQVQNDSRAMVRKNSVFFNEPLVRLSNWCLLDLALSQSNRLMKLTNKRLSLKHQFENPSQDQPF